MWLGIAHCDERIDCHTRKGLDDQAFQCAGAAVFRANVVKWVADPLLRLERDKERVFGSNAEFASHHLRRKVSPNEASALAFKARLAGLEG